MQRTTTWRMLWVAFAVLLGLLATACGGSDDDDAGVSADTEDVADAPDEEEGGDGSGEDEPTDVTTSGDEPEEGEDIGGSDDDDAGGSADEAEPEEGVLYRVGEFCESFAGLELDEGGPVALCLGEAEDSARPVGFHPDFLNQLFIEKCPSNTSFAGSYRYWFGPNTDEVSLYFWNHMMVRFHPADEFERGVSGILPADGFGIPDGSTIWVVDTGLHGAFITSIIQAMTGESAVQVPTQEVPDVAAIWKIVNFDLVNYGLATTEAGIVGALEVIGQAIEKTGTEGNVINLSLAAYNCGEEPMALLTAMNDLIAQGVRFAVSAGNDETDEPIFPAAWGPGSDQITTVGAHGEDDTKRSCFSNFGSSEVWFPGEEIDGNNGIEDGTWSGTSFSTPQAAVHLAADVGMPAATGGTPGPTHTITVTPATGPSFSGETYCAAGSRYQPVGAVYQS